MRAPLALALLSVRCALAQPCAPAALPGDGAPGTDGGVRAMLVFDFDGPGPQPPELVIGGSFTVAGTATCSGIARWDGTHWNRIGTQALDVWDMTSFDPDGAGPALPQLIVAGSLVGSSGNYWKVLRWNGTTWDIISPPSFLMPQCVASFDPGDAPPRLIAGGYDILPGTLYHGVQQWDGSQWTPLGLGLGNEEDGGASALLPYDPDGPGPQPTRLIVGGSFIHAGGQPANSIAAWDGASWSPLGSGVTNTSPPSVNALKLWDAGGGGPPILVVGGEFDHAGGIPAAGIATWDGAAWRALGSGLWLQNFPAAVYSLGVHDFDGPGPLPPRLFAGGQFTLGGSTVTLAQFVAGDWAPVAAQTQYVTTPRLSAEMSTYLPPGGDPRSPLLVVAASVSPVNGLPAKSIALWNDSAWAPVAGGFDSDVFSLASYSPAAGDPPQIIAGGRFLSAGHISAHAIARFDGQSWHSMGSGIEGPAAVVNALLPFDDPVLGRLLIAGGFFSLAGGQSAGNVAAWNGTSWTRLGSLAMPGSGPVSALAEFDLDGPGPQPPSIFAALQWGFGGVQRWTGTAWEQVGSDFNLVNINHEYAEIDALAVFDPDGDGPLLPSLYAAGFFNRVGSTVVGNIARWNGSSWESVGSGIPALRVRALASFDPDGPGPLQPLLIAVGQPYTATSTVMAWNGSTWSSLNSTTASQLNAVLSFDPDGPGPFQPQLIVAGVGTTYSPLISRWTGSSWSSIAAIPQPSGFYPSVSALSSWTPEPGAPPELVLGGSFGAINDGASASFARLRFPTCYANCDCSSVPPVLSVFDFQCFLNQFASGKPYANCDGSSIAPVLNVNDFQCFLNAYAAGCP